MMKTCLGLLPLLPMALLIGVEPARGGEESYRVLLEWRFDKPGDLRGWSPGNLSDVKVEAGCLRATPRGSDPILTSPLLDLAANQYQWVRIELRSTGGMSEFYFTNTTEGRFGGFSPKKLVTQPVEGGTEWTTLVIQPFWGPERKIVRIRFDPPSSGPVEIRSIQVVEAAAPAIDKATAWQLHGARQPGVFARRVSAPLADVDYVQIRMAVRGAANGRLEYALDKLPGLHVMNFPLRADGRMHVYHLDPGAKLPWSDTLAWLALTPALEPGAEVTLDSVALVREPTGAPDVEIRYFGASDALMRAGRPGTVLCSLVNNGGPLAEGGTARLTLPDGAKVIGPAEIRVPAIPNSVARELEWKIEAPGPVNGTARVEVNAGGERLSAECALAIGADLGLAKADYVPEPKPVDTGPYQVGVYYFPGWADASRWQPLRAWPNRKPVLGWYAEGSPEVADWQIKWMLEHGITWIAYDWYWCKGARHLEHGLHDAFFKARYQSMMKFCLLYANHNPPHTTSVEDSVELTKFWIENYFRRPNYLRVDGRPVMIIFSPRRITEDVGHENVKAMFDRMDEVCREAGIPGIYMVACTAGDPRVAESLKEEGYSALSGYNYPGLNAGAAHLLPYAKLTETTENVWRQVADAAILKALPAVSGGWDPRPWHGPDPRVYYPDRNPTTFLDHCRAVRQFFDTRDRPPHLCIIEAWNEWGEGSYIEPHAEYGFEYLDAVRQVFAPKAGPHVDLAPADVGLGPYDVPRLPLRTRWEFNTDGDTEGWRGMMQVADLRAEGGALRGKAAGNDPALSSPPLEVEAGRYATIEVRMKAARPDRAQVFWGTTTSRLSGQSSISFDVKADGQMHDYRLPVGEHRRWRGIVSQLRLDPGNELGNAFEIDSIRLLEK